MSPRYEISGERDLAFSQWHRRVFDDDAAALDIDLVGMCKRCNQPIYMIETTRADKKSTTWTEVIARKCQVPAFVVFYREADDETGSFSRFDAYSLHYGARTFLGGSYELSVVLNGLRQLHDQEDHGLRRAA